MDIADSVEFCNRLVMLAELFDLKLAATRQALYFEALRDLSFESVAKALNQAAKTCKFFPKPAELRALAVGDTEDLAEAAWMGLRKAMTRVGSYSSLIADAALGESIIAVFGSWPEACALELSQEMWASKRKEFGRVFRVLRDRDVRGSRYLPGNCETQNAGRKDWAKYTPVAHLTAGGIKTLTAAQAETVKTQIAASAHGFSRIEDSLKRMLPPREGDTA